MIKEFNKENLKKLRMEINEALEKIQEFHGINITLGNISYSDKEFSVKLNCAVLGDDGMAKPEYLVNWEAGYWRKHGLRETDLNKAFKADDGEWYKVVGCSQRSSKYGIMALHVKTGKVYKMSYSMVQPKLSV